MHKLIPLQNCHKCHSLDPSDNTRLPYNFWEADLQKSVSSTTDRYTTCRIEWLVIRFVMEKAKPSWNLLIIDDMRKLLKEIISLTVTEWACHSPRPDSWVHLPTDPILAFLKVIKRDYSVYSQVRYKRLCWMWKLRVVAIV
jgi:hypothetical protein